MFVSAEVREALQAQNYRDATGSASAMAFSRCGHEAAIEQKRPHSAKAYEDLGFAHTKRSRHWEESKGTQDVTREETKQIRVTEPRLVPRNKRAFRGVTRSSPRIIYFTGHLHLKGPAKTHWETVGLI
jgi:hypothetical protein